MTPTSLEIRDHKKHLVLVENKAAILITSHNYFEHVLIVKTLIVKSLIVKTLI